MPRILLKPNYSSLLLYNLFLVPLSFFCILLFVLPLSHIHLSLPVHSSCTHEDASALELHGDVGPCGHGKKKKKSETGLLIFKLVSLSSNLTLNPNFVYFFLKLNKYNFSESWHTSKVPHFSHLWFLTYCVAGLFNWNPRWFLYVLNICVHIFCICVNYLLICLWPRECFFLLLLTKMLFFLSSYVTSKFNSQKD